MLKINNTQYNPKGAMSVARIGSKHVYVYQKASDTLLKLFGAVLADRMFRHYFPNESYLKEVEISRDHFAIKVKRLTTDLYWTAQRRNAWNKRDVHLAYALACEYPEYSDNYGGYNPDHYVPLDDHDGNWGVYKGKCILFDGIYRANMLDSEKDSLFVKLLDYLYENKIKVTIA